MRTEIRASLNLNHFYYHNENYEWTTEMPCFWFSFFKIDGSTCQLNESLGLEGNAVVYSSFNKVEKLNNIKPDNFDFLRIPPHLGMKEITLLPIPVPSFVQKNGIEDLESYMGCVAVLMNEECAENDDKNNYSRILKSTIQTSLNELVPLVNKRNDLIINHLDQLKKDIEFKIVKESKKQQNFWKRITTENIVNTTIWKFSSEELYNMAPLSLAKYWGSEGIWELAGEIKVNYSSSIKSVKKRKTVQVH